MTSRERVDAVFEGRCPDRIPVHHVSVSSDVASALLGREAYVGGGIQSWREAKALWDGPDAHAEFIERSYRDAIDVAVAMGNDVVRPAYWRCGRRPTRRLDENTFLFEIGPEREWQVLKYDPPTEQAATLPYGPRPSQTADDLETDVEVAEESLDDYDPNDEDRDFYYRAMDEIGAERVVRMDGVGLCIPRDQTWLEAVVLRPDLVRRHLDVQVEHVLRRIEVLTARGFRYLFGGGDFATAKGPMYSPRVFAELMVPRLRRISDACHRHGAKHLFASDGDLWPVADALFGEAGVDGFYEIDRRAGMDLSRLRARFADLTLLGNVSSHSLHLGSAEDVAAEVRDCMAAAHRHGRIVVGVSNYIVPGTPIENVRTMMRTIEDTRET